MVVVNGYTIEPYAYLFGVNLSAADLTGADLIGATLTFVDFTQAELTEADLSGAILNRANLNYATLSSADLTNASLKHTTLKHANLSGATLFSVNLKDADFTNADLTNVTSGNSKKVFVAYNRRFYKVVNYAKEFCDRNEGGSVNINIPDSKQGKNRFLSNGCHIIDLARYILGDFEILKKIIRNNHETNEMEILTALCSNQKWSITINAHSLIPANFGITINSKKEVFELLPIEKFSLYEGLEIIEPNDEYPLRRYLPKIIKTEFEDSEFKPGFNNMYRQFYQFIKTNYKKTENSVTINEARSTLKKCIELIN